MITSSALRSGEVLKKGLPSSTGPNLSVLSGPENSIQIQRMVRTISVIRDSSLYDNIFFQADAVPEYRGRCGIDRFDETDFGNDDKAANLAVRDHCPVWAVFSMARDDDGSDEGGSAPVPEPQSSEDVPVNAMLGQQDKHFNQWMQMANQKPNFVTAKAANLFGTTQGKRGMSGGGKFLPSGADLKSTFGRKSVLKSKQGAGGMFQRAANPSVSGAHQRNLLSG